MMEITPSTARIRPPALADQRLLAVFGSVPSMLPFCSTSFARKG